MVSRDGAETWTEIGKTAGDMLGFALSPDGSKLAYGGPGDPVTVASTSDLQPEARAAIGVRCLTWSTAGLYACATEYPDGFTVGLSKDDGRTFHAKYNLSHLSPLECAATTTTGRDCPREWAAVQATIGTPVDDTGTEPAVDGAVSNDGPREAADDGGCGCVVGRSTVAPISLLAMALAAIFSFVRRKR
jgi:hypothetical protein